jgi:hypothetical protein
LRTIESLTCTMLAESHRRSDLIANITGASGLKLRAPESRVTLSLLRCPLSS